MEFIKKLSKKKNFWYLVVVIFFGILASRTLLFQSGYFNMHDDLQMMRQLVMEKCFLQFQIPCRWTQHMGYGFGFPLFNFYPPLPYLVGELFRVIGFSFVTTIKWTFALSIIVSGVTMFFLASEFFGPLGGVLSSVFYVWAPYHSVDVYVRGAMNEAWALTWFPLIFWAAYKLIKEKKNTFKWMILVALSWFLLLTSHNLMVLILTPFFGVWVLLWMWKLDMWSRLLSFIKSGLLAFGMAAFFTIPVLLEAKLVQIDTLVVGYYEWIAHFSTTAQILFSRFWGYGPSVWMDKDDGMPFQIGHIHWILSLVIGAWLVLTIFKNRGKIKKTLKKSITLPLLFMFVSGWFTLFMTHSKSTFIWSNVNILEIVQFPWRFLAIATFTFSFLAGSVVLIIKDEGKKKIIVGLLAIGLVIFNWNYFLPKGGKMLPLTDEEKFAGKAWDLQQTAGIYDYLPNLAKQAPQEPQSLLAEVMEGEAVITNEWQNSKKISFDIDVTSENTLVRLGLFKFPGWIAYVDGKKIENFVPETENWGRMYVEVPSGEHTVKLKLTNTFPRTLGNIISLVTWVLLIRYFRKKKKK